MNKVTVRHNTAKKGIEVEFNAKPSREVLEYLKSQKFRWSFKLGYWWRGAWGDTASNIAAEIEAIDPSLSEAPYIPAELPAPKYVQQFNKSGEIDVVTVPSKLDMLVGAKVTRTPQVEAIDGMTPLGMAETIPF